MTHTDAELLLAAGAVLDDLAPDERVAYEAHRVACPACRRAEVELDHVLADLALVVPERVPPADLLAGIRRALGTDGPVAASRNGSGVAGTGLDAVAGAGPVGLPHVTRRDPSTAPVLPTGGATPTLLRARRGARARGYAALGLAAALGVVAVGLGARTAALERDLEAAAARVASLEQALAQQGDAMTVAMDPSHVTVALHPDALAPAAEAAVVYVPGTDTSWIVARNLPATPSGHGYQLWYADEAGVHPLQTVPHDGTGTFLAPVGVDLAESAAVMLTLEPTGGAQGEPGPQVVFGEL